MKCKNIENKWDHLHKTLTDQVVAVHMYHNFFQHDFKRERDIELYPTVVSILVMMTPSRKTWSP